jgi:hypothetical protein
MHTGTIGQWHIAVATVPVGTDNVNVSFETEPNQFTDATLLRPEG